jgi:hypothetical protein
MPGAGYANAFISVGWVEERNPTSSRLKTLCLSVERKPLRLVVRHRLTQYIYHNLGSPVGCVVAQRNAP